MPAKPAVVLLSGGLDSATVLSVAAAQGFDTHALSFRYGQRHAYELQAASEIARRQGARRHVVVDFDLRTFGGSALTADLLKGPHKLAIRDRDSVPGRHLLDAGFDAALGTPLFLADVEKALRGSPL